MCGEGILVEDVVVSDSLNLFEDSLFCIQLQRQYSAARELEEFLDLCASEGGMQSHTTEKYFNVLKVHYALNNYTFFISAFREVVTMKISSTIPICLNVSPILFTSET